VDGPRPRDRARRRTAAPAELALAGRYRLVRRIGLSDLRLHDLRHAFASRLLEANVHPKIVSEALGRSSVSFTMDTCQHLMPTLQEQAVQAIEDALGEALGGTVAAQPETL
jgi:integrase